MTGTLIFERTCNHSYSFPFEEIRSTCEKSCHNFYQHKIRQLLTENRYREKQNAKYSQQNQLESQFNSTRFHKEYMNQIREKIKMRSPNDDNEKRSNDVMSVTRRCTNDAVTFAITSSNIPTTNKKILTKSKRKSTLQTKQISS